MRPVIDVLQRPLTHLMTQGGDARITLAPATGLNRYHVAPEPRDVLALASSTANDLSAPAFTYLSRRFGDDPGRLADGAGYAALLDELRTRLRVAYALDPAVDVFFAPSGTDLEYVALLAVAGRRVGGVTNLLLGADEVGSGCIHSAAGRYFAEDTALGTQVTVGGRVAGLPATELLDLPVRVAGVPRDSVAITADMTTAVAHALASGRFPLVHVVHGSKTGLVLPEMNAIDALRARFGGDIAFVVDACQARISARAIRDYLARGMIVLLTGSKFMGGPPFSGFALLPRRLCAAASPLSGSMRLFRRAEVPETWRGRENLDDDGNPGLGLRLAAALFELDRFRALAPEGVAAIITAFTRATDRLIARLGIREVAADASGRGGCADEAQTLVTLDVSQVAGKPGLALDFDAAGRIHKALIARGIRLGQPVRSVKLPDGEWGATLRIGLSMPLMCTAAGDEAGIDRLEAAIGRVGDALAVELARGA